MKPPENPRYGLIRMYENEWIQVLDRKFPGGQVVVKTFAGKRAEQQAKEWIATHETNIP